MRAHHSASDLWWLSAREAQRLIRRKRLSPVELVRACLERVQALNDTLNAYIALYAEEALREAQRLEAEAQQGAWRGPLHGIPVALKDIFATAGQPTTVGSRILRDFIPQEDAVVVHRLKEAGAILLGKLNLHEFAYGITTVNPHFGPTRNPWDTSRIPGGSSGGSAAAVASGMCPLSLGTDTGGSIRIPSALCGIVGLKPTYGRVSRRGVFPLAWSMDHAGPMARTVEDTALLLGVIAGYDPHDPGSAHRPVPNYLRNLEKGVKGMVLGVLTESALGVVDTDVETAFGEALRALEGLGAKVEEVAWPEAEGVPGAHLAILMAEASALHQRWVKERPQDYGEDVRLRLLAGLALPGTLYLKAQQVRRKATSSLLALLERVNALLLPTCPVTAPLIGAERVSIAGRSVDVRTALTRFVSPFNLTGVPALSVPWRVSHEGLPIGVQVVVKPFDETTVLQVGYALEQTAPSKGKRPPL
ncbi:Glutamyl-tRNA(Gln) amidotransferase subunit A [bacterium HR23]|nr:Glutamyl-tRNA(Gln) amidotransferase subunit A [bacterium HR23]